MKRSRPRGPRPSRKQLRDTALLWLRDRNFPELVAWARAERRAVSTLIALLFDGDELVRWRAIEGLGRVAGARAAADPESVRTLLRHFFWSMNDESGSVIWCAAEAVGEILANAPAFIDEYAHLLPSYLAEEPFERGAHWAVARVSRLRPDVFAERVDEIARSLADPDPYIRSHAGLALVRIEGGVARAGVAALLRDETVVGIYDPATGELREAEVRAIVGAG